MPTRVYVERAGRLELSNCRFTDDDRVRAAIERIIMPLGRRIDESSPLCGRAAEGWNPASTRSSRAPWPCPRILHHHSKVRTRSAHPREPWVGVRHHGPKPWRGFWTRTVYFEKEHRHLGRDGQRQGRPSWNVLSSAIPSGERTSSPSKTRPSFARPAARRLTRDEACEHGGQGSYTSVPQDSGHRCARACGRPNSWSENAVGETRRHYTRTPAPR